MLHVCSASTEGVQSRGSGAGLGGEGSLSRLTQLSACCVGIEGEYASCTMKETF